MEFTAPPYQEISDLNKDDNKIQLNGSTHQRRAQLIAEGMFWRRINYFDDFQKK